MDADTVSLAQKNANQDLVEQYISYLTLFDKVDKDFQKKKTFIQEQEYEQIQKQEKYMSMFKQKDEIYQQCMKQIVQDLNLLNLNIFGIIFQRVILAMKDDKNSLLELQKSQIQEKCQSKEEERRLLQLKHQMEQGKVMETEGAMQKKINNLQVILKNQEEQIKELVQKFNQNELICRNLKEQNQQANSINENLIGNLYQLKLMEQEQSDDDIFQRLKKSNEQLVRTIQHMNKVEKLKQEQKYIYIHNERQIKEQKKREIDNEDLQIQPSFDRSIITTEKINTYKVQVQFQGVNNNYQRLGQLLQNLEGQITSLNQITQINQLKNTGDREVKYQYEDQQFHHQIYQFMMQKIQDLSLYSGQIKQVNQQINEQIQGVNESVLHFQENIEDYQIQFQILDIQNQGLIKKYRQKIEELQKMVEEVDSLQSRNSRLIDQMKVMEEQNQNLEILSKRSNYKEQGQEVKALELQVQSLNHQIDKLKLYINDINRQSEEKDKKIRELKGMEQEYNDMKSRYSQFTQNVRFHRLKDNQYSINTDNSIMKKKKSQFIKNLMKKYRVSNNQQANNEMEGLTNQTDRIVEFQSDQNQNDVVQSPELVDRSNDVLKKSNDVSRVSIEMLKKSIEKKSEQWKKSDDQFKKSDFFDGGVKEFMNYLQENQLTETLVQLEFLKKISDYFQKQNMFGQDNWQYLEKVFQRKMDNLYRRQYLSQFGHRNPVKQNKQENNKPNFNKQSLNNIFNAMNDIVQTQRTHNEKEKKMTRKMSQYQIKSQEESLEQIKTIDNNSELIMKVQEKKMPRNFHQRCFSYNQFQNRSPRKYMPYSPLISNQQLQSYKKKYQDEGLMFLDVYNKLHDLIVNSTQTMNEEIQSYGLSYLFDQKHENGKTVLKLPSYRTFREKVLESEQYQVNQLNKMLGQNLVVIQQSSSNNNQSVHMTQQVKLPTINR